MIFRKGRTGEQIDLIAYSKEMIERYEQKRQRGDGDIKIYVGCDSQNKRYDICYITVIAFRHNDKGADYIYCKESIKKDRAKDRKIKDLQVIVNQRLWGEVERSLATALRLREGGIPVYCVDLDLNDEEGTGSNNLAAAGRGYIVAEGFKCTIKPEEQVASRAADSLVRK